jgi:rare lipoprotein A
MRSLPAAGRVAASDGNAWISRVVPVGKIGAGLAIALLTANCAQQNAVASRGGGGRVDPRYGVKPSPRVIPEGQPIPKGGGREMVGKPYVVAGRTYVPHESASYLREGLASWYGADFHGRLTANGEIFDRQSIAAAHATMPLPSYARVTNLRNGRSIVVRVNDRGPFHAGRLIDVSERAAESLEFKRVGTTEVRVEYVGRASVHGSDDGKLLASLREGSRPAGSAATTAVAEIRPRATVPAAVIRESRPDRSEPEPLPGRYPVAAAQPRPAAHMVLAAASVPGPPSTASARAAPRIVAGVSPSPERTPAAASVKEASAARTTTERARPTQNGMDRRAMAGLFFAGAGPSSAGRPR